MSFERAFAITAQLEKWDTTNTRGDPGGLTQCGLSKVYNPDLDIGRLTPQQVQAAYRTRYYDAHNCGLLPWPWDAALFDGWVNPGPGSISITAEMQLALGTFPDGAIGPATLLAAQHAGPWHVAEFVRRRLVRMSGATDANLFLQGWTNRLFQLAYLIGSA